MCDVEARHSSHLEDKGAVEEEHTVGVGVEGGAEGGCAVERSLGSLLEGGVCREKKSVSNSLAILAEVNELYKYSYKSYL